MPEITGPRRCLAAPGGSSSVASHHQTYARDGRGGDSEGSTLGLEGTTPNHYQYWPCSWD